MVTVEVKHRRVSVSAILVLVLWLATSGCERLFGPLVVNETDTSVQIEMMVIVTRTNMEESFWYKLKPGETSPWWPYSKPRELISVTITYDEEKLIKLDRQYLSTALSKIGGQKQALLIVRSDGVQIVNMLAYWQQKRRGG